MKFSSRRKLSEHHERSIQSGMGLPHSKTLRSWLRSGTRASVLKCGSPVTLFHRLSAASILSIAVVLAFGIPVQAQPLNIRTFAGSTTPGSTNGPGPTARFSHPVGLATDLSGNIYVADTENSTIRKITPDGNVSTIAGLPGNFGSTDAIGAGARFYGPQALAANNAGQLFVADSANSTIRKVTSGVVSTFAGAAGNFNSFDGTGSNAQFYHPEGVATDAGGNVYVADTWNHTIRKITPAGAVSTLAGLAGNFGAADGTNSKARFNRPAGIAVDSATNIFIADSLNHTVRKITPNGTVRTIAGLAGVWGSSDGTNTAARFYLPEGISVAANGDLFVTDSGNQTLRQISFIGTNWVVTTVAGLNGFAGSMNGTGASAQFNFPAGIAFDNSGYLYAADTGNNTIRTTRIISPSLQFAAIGNQFILSWPVWADGFVLEQSSLLGPSANWSPITDNIFVVADNFVHTNNLTESAYFRLSLQ
jgi:sugar lactone lactonase YvrE